MNKEITAPIKKEIIWKELDRTKDLIAYLYRNTGDGIWSWQDEQMEKLFYELNEISLKLAEDEDMQWQLEEKEEQEAEEILRNSEEI